MSVGFPTADDGELVILRKRFWDRGILMQSGTAVFVFFEIAAFWVLDQIQFGPGTNPRASL